MYNINSSSHHHLIVIIIDDANRHAVHKLIVAEDQSKVREELKQCLRVLTAGLY
jgi:hypothetical protein